MPSRRRPRSSRRVCATPAAAALHRACAWSLAAALAALALLVAPRALRAQALSPEAAAQVRFNHGRELYLAHDYDAALAEFRAANALVASPNTRMYIARCLREGGHLAEAYTELQRAAGEAADRSAREPRYAATRDAARAEAATLQPRIGTITVHVPFPPEGVAVTVGGAQVPAAGWDVATPIDPGHVEVAATAPGRRAFGTAVDVRAGQNTDVTIELPVDPNATPPAGAGRGTGQGAGGPALGADTERAPATRRETVGGGVRIAGAVVMSVGAVLGIGFVVFGTLAESRYNDLTAVCNSGGSQPAPCDGRVPESQIAEGEQYQTLANVSLGLGLTALVAGTVMVIVGGPRTVEVPAMRARGGGLAGALRATAAPASRASSRASRGGGVLPWGSVASGMTGGLAGLRFSF